VLPLWEAWLALLTQQAMGHSTYVLYDIRRGEGFVQIRYRLHQAAADITYLAPALGESRLAPTAWSYLLDAVGTEVAGRGLQRIFASLPESSPEADLFHQAGFVPYAREDLYCLARPPVGQAGTVHSALRPQSPEDWPAIQKLCVAITPQRVRQAEGGILTTTGGEQSCRRYVLPGAGGDELQAALMLCTGSKGHWLRLLLHPDARDVADDLVAYALSTLDGNPGQPVYCNVRQYEGGVRAALGAAGFEPHETRTLTVKHTLAWSKSALPELAQALKGAEAVPPAYRIKGEPEFQPITRETQ
jgi:hypothetical protein